MAIEFTSIELPTDLTDFIDLSNVLKRTPGNKGKGQASWKQGKKEVFRCHQTVCQSYIDRSVDGVVEEGTFHKFFDKHDPNGDLDRLVRALGVKLANDGWLCITLHSRPDENIKMEWLRGSQLLTFNLYR